MTLDELYEYAWAQGIEIDEVPMREVVAMAFPEGWIAIDSSKVDSLTHFKCLLAHEIGHIETGSFYNVYSPFCLRAQCEHKADKRAAAILMPYNDVVKALRHGYVTISALAEFFDVTPEFAKMAIRLYYDRIHGVDCFDRVSSGF